MKKVPIKELTTRERSNTILALHRYSGPGEMPERSKGAVLKTAARKCRGFESLSLRCPCRCLAHVSLQVARRGGRAAEGNRLLSGLAPKSATRVRIPPSPLLVR